MQAAGAKMKMKCMADGGLVGSIKGMLGIPSAPAETVTQKYARQDAERMAKSAPAAAPAPVRQNAISDYAGMGAMKRREAAAGMKHGGPVKGKGTATSDSVPAMLSKGEYVMPADSVKHFGVKTLDAMRKATHTPIAKLGAKRHPDAESKAEDKGEPKGAEKREGRGAIRKMADGGRLHLADGTRGTVEDELRRQRAAAASAVGAVEDKAVFGLYPQVTGGSNRATHATDNALRTGVVATGPSTFQPAPPVAPLVTALPAGVVPSTAGAGRGSAASFGVNPNAPVMPAPAAATQAQMPLPAGVSPSDAGAGRGSLNPALAGTVAPDDLSGPRLAGAVGSTAGMPVDGADGVRKFKTQDGRTLYSNVAGAADNNKLMSANPGLQTIPSFQGTGAGPATAGGAPALGARGAGSGSLDQQLSAARSAAADRGDWDAIKASYAAQGQTFNGGSPPQATGVIGQIQADLANGKRLTARGAQVLNEAMRAQNEQTQQGSIASLGARRLALDTATHAQDAPLKGAQAAGAVQVQAAKDAYAKAAASGDQKAMAQAEETLRVMGVGRDRNIPPPRQLVVPGGTTPDPANPGQYIHQPSMVFNPDTGQFVQPPSAQAAKPAIAEGSISTVNGKSAKYIGGKWVPQ